MNSDSLKYPTIDEIRNARLALGDQVRTTPTWEWRGDEVLGAVGENTRLFLKLELFQYAGSFKPRGALTVMRSLSADELRRGVVAVSAGNHAMAVGYAARVLKSSAKVVMPRTANIARVNGCKAFGAEVILAENVHEAFEVAKQLGENEGRYFVHPFEGPLTALGTATVGLEFMEQVPNLDLVIIPIGGGGLAAGMACAVKQLNPRCKVLGVEPVGADTMSRSFKSGSPERIESVQTIADSLGAPYSLPYSFGLCRKFVDEIVLVSDDEIVAAMKLLFRSMKLAVEPAGAAATAAVLGPLKTEVMGRSVGITVCGANISSERFCELLSRK